MNFGAFLVIMAVIAVANHINRDIGRGPQSATHEDVKGANGPAEPN